MSFQVGVGGTVFFQVGLCTPLQIMCILLVEYFMLKGS